MVLYGLSQVNIWFAVMGGLTIILGAYYMFKMYQNVMLGETNERPFADLNFNELFVMILIVAVLIFFGLYPKPISDLITPSLKPILFFINR